MEKWYIYYKKKTRTATTDKKVIYLFKKKKQEKLLLTSDVEKIVTVKERHYWKFIKQILFLLNYILFIIKICQMCKIKSHWMFSVVFFMFYICVICDCVCVLKYAIYLIWPRQFSFGPCFFNLAHTLARTKNEPEGTLLTVIFWSGQHS